MQLPFIIDKELEHSYIYIAYHGAALDTSLEAARSVFDVNFFGALRVARAVIPHMAKRKQGVIANVGSVVGELYVYPIRVIEKN